MSDIFVPKWRSPEEDYNRFSEIERQRYNISKPRSNILSSIGKNTLKGWTITHRFGGGSIFSGLEYVYNSQIDPCKCGWKVAKCEAYPIEDIIENVSHIMWMECDECYRRTKPVYILRSEGLSERYMDIVEVFWNLKIKPSAYDNRILELVDTEMNKDLHKYMK